MKFLDVTCKHCRQSPRNPSTSFKICLVVFLYKVSVLKLIESLFLRGIQLLFYKNISSWNFKFIVQADETWETRFQSPTSCLQVYYILRSQAYQVTFTACISWMFKETCKCWHQSLQDAKSYKKCPAWKVHYWNCCPSTRSKWTGRDKLWPRSKKMLIKKFSFQPQPSCAQVMPSMYMPYTEGPKMDWTMKWVVQQISQVVIKMWKYIRMWACDVARSKKLQEGSGLEWQFWFRPIHFLELIQQRVDLRSFMGKVWIVL